MLYDYRTEKALYSCLLTLLTLHGKWPPVWPAGQHQLSTSKLELPAANKEPQVDLNKAARPTLQPRQQENLCQLFGASLSKLCQICP